MRGLFPTRRFDQTTNWLGERAIARDGLPAAGDIGDHRSAD